MRPLIRKLSQPFIKSSSVASEITGAADTHDLIFGDRQINSSTSIFYAYMEKESIAGFTVKIRALEDFLARDAKELALSTAKEFSEMMIRTSERCPLHEISFSLSLVNVDVFEVFMSALTRVHQFHDFTLNLQQYRYTGANHRSQTIMKAKILEDMLRSTPPVQIQHIKLADNNFLRAETRLLCDAIATHGLRVRTLELGQNEVGYFSLNKVVEQCGNLEVLDLHGAVDFSPCELGRTLTRSYMDTEPINLKVLKLNNIPFRVSELRLLVESLKSSANVSHISLCNCSIGRSDGSGMRCVKKLLKNPKLKYLSLEKNNIAKAGIGHLFEELRTNMTLEMLSLRFNDISLAAVREHMIPDLQIRMEAQDELRSKVATASAVAPYNLSIDMRGNVRAYRYGQYPDPDTTRALFEVTSANLLGDANSSTMEGLKYFTRMHLPSQETEHSLRLAGLAAGPDVYFSLDKMGMLQHNISNLQRLALSHQGLTAIKKSWCFDMKKHMPKLRELDLSHNAIERLPKEILVLSCPAATDHTAATSHERHAFMLKLVGNKNSYKNGEIQDERVLDVMFGLGTSLIGLSREQNNRIVMARYLLYHNIITLFQDFTETQNEDPIDLEADVVRHALNVRGLDYHVNAVNEDGRTPLHFACMYARARMIEWLIDAGAYIDIVDKYGYFPSEMYRYRYLRYYRTQQMASSVRWDDTMGQDPAERALSAKTCLDEYVLLFKLNDLHQRRSLGYGSSTSGGQKDISDVMLDAYLTESQEWSMLQVQNENRPQNAECHARRMQWRLLLGRMNTSEFMRGKHTQQHLYLHHACIKGHVGQVEVLVEMLKGHLFVQDSYEWRTPFHYAAIFAGNDVMGTLTERAKQMEILEGLQTQGSKDSENNNAGKRTNHHHRDSLGNAVGYSGKDSQQYDDTMLNRWKGMLEKTLVSRCQNVTSVAPEPTAESVGGNANSIPKKKLLKRPHWPSALVRKGHRHPLDSVGSKRMKQLSEVEGAGLFDVYQKSALHYCIQELSPENVERLCELGGVDPLTPRGSDANAYSCAIAMNAVYLQLDEKIKNSSDSDDKFQRSVQDQMSRSRAQLDVINGVPVVSGVRDKFLSKQFCKSFIPYLVFLLLLTVAIPSSTGQGWVPESTYYLNQKTIDMIINEEIASEKFATGFHDINNLGDTWAWLEGPFLELFPTSDTYGNTYTTNLQKYVYGKNRLLGAVRMRQLRVKGDSCWGRSENFEDPLFSCSTEFYLEEEEKASFTANGNTYYWSDSDEGPGTTGIKALFYPDRGYIVDFVPGDGSTVSTQVSTLKTDQWISDYVTRAIFIEFSLYNGAHNMITFCQLKIEMPATGGVIASSNFNSFHPVTGSTFEIITTMIFEVLLFIFVMLHLLSELLELFQTGCAYLKVIWNWWDIGVLLLFFGKWLCQLMMLIEWLRLDIDVDDSQTNFYPLLFVSNLHFAARNLAAILMIACWLRLVKYLRTLPHIGPVIGAVVATCVDIKTLVFLGLMTLSWATCAIGAHLGLGPDLTGYKNFPQTMLSILRMVLGDFDADELQDKSPYFGTILWLLVIIFGSLLMLNLLIAVLSEVYAEKWETNDSKWSDVINAMLADNLDDSRDRKIILDLFHWICGCDPCLWFFHRGKDPFEEDLDVEAFLPANFVIKNNGSRLKSVLRLDYQPNFDGETSQDSDSTQKKNGFVNIAKLKIKAMRRFKGNRQDAAISAQPKHFTRSSSVSSIRGMNSNSRSRNPCTKMKLLCTKFLQRYHSRASNAVRDIMEYDLRHPVIDAGVTEIWMSSLRALSALDWTKTRQAVMEASERRVEVSTPDTLEDKMDRILQLMENSSPSNYYAEVQALMSEIHNATVGDVKVVLSEMRKESGGEEKTAKPGAGGKVTGAKAGDAKKDDEKAKKAIHRDVLGDDSALHRLVIGSLEDALRKEFDTLRQKYEFEAIYGIPKQKDDVIGGGSYDCVLRDVPIKELKDLQEFLCKSPLFEPCKVTEKGKGKEGKEGKEVDSVLYCQPEGLSLKMGKNEYKPGHKYVWGDEDKSKVLSKMFKEIQDGEMTLKACADYGKEGHESHVERVLCVAKMAIRREDKDGSIFYLLESHQDRGHGGFNRRFIQPSEKFKGTEDPMEGARRGVLEEFGGHVTGLQDVIVVPESEKVLVEVLFSPSFPGMETAYLLYFYDMLVPTLPSENFITSEDIKENGVPTGDVEEHRWEWVTESHFQSMLRVGAIIRSPLKIMDDVLDLAKQKLEKETGESIECNKAKFADVYEEVTSVYDEMDEMVSKMAKKNAEKYFNANRATVFRERVENVQPKPLVENFSNPVVLPPADETPAVAPDSSGIVKLVDSRDLPAPPDEARSGQEATATSTEDAPTAPPEVRPPPGLSLAALTSVSGDHGDEHAPPPIPPAGADPDSEPPSPGAPPPPPPPMEM